MTTINAPAAVPATRAERVTNYISDNRLFFVVAVALLALVLMADPAAAQITNTEGIALTPSDITAGLYGGMNMILGVTGLLTILMLPAGLQFAVNLIRGITNMFSGFRF